MYLSANLFHKPKFPEINFWNTWILYCWRSGANKKVAKNVAIGRQKLEKDLDIGTYIRTVNKVRGIV